MALYRIATAVSLLACAISGVELSPQCPRGCHEPPGSYPWMSTENAVQLPALLGDTNYTISWVFGPDGQVDVPVQIQWRMGSVVWDTNTTKHEYIFNPGKVLGSFPTAQAPYMTPESAWFNASQHSGNILIISQPAAVGMGKDFPVALSQPFTVQSGIIKDYIQTQIDISRQTEYNRWRLGVSIGLGIGIPFLVVIITFVVLLAVKLQARNQGDKDVEVVHNDALGW
ncbi:hypothetical protein E0Z10_g8697 [Xylaria hypoxylon]|uniref:DOMON domain-containing protein n=1 Tax=Xylaria hypoxylon TaxID=37992 RepID=A0A4Z0YN48_9PEZI|nr:hypothetical protein E0Z10_g8697 [Xylaria hypoxylon]